MAELPKVCRYLHIPAQSGSDRILKAMNRNYTAAEYLELLAKARQIVPDIAIAGDFIVGFPGETDEDFEATVRSLAKGRVQKFLYIQILTPPRHCTPTKNLKTIFPPKSKNSGICGFSKCRTKSAKNTISDL